ncbi:MAG: DUF456 domain-containing protein [Intrasporangiaceae bacterium]|nr:DUF456 domain-containing protein [Intrasporangiaceae bacterium]
MSEGALIALCAILLVVGTIGIVVPVLPGLLIVLGAVLLWAIGTGGTTAWIIFGIAAVVWVVGVVAQFLIPGRKLKTQGIGLGTLTLAVIAAIIGFFVIPVVGAFVGFVLAIYLVEMTRSRDSSAAWTRTKQALRAILHSMGIELITAFAIAVLFVVGVLIT